MKPEDFLVEHADQFAWSVPDGVPSGLGVTPVAAFTGRGNHPLEVALAAVGRRLRADEMRRVWIARYGKAPNPLLLVSAYQEDGGWKASICGPVGDEPPVESGLELPEVERIAAAALAEPSRHAAIRFLGSIWAELENELPGLRNQGMLATHELRDGVPSRRDWRDACERGRALLGYRGRELVEHLGFSVETHATAASLLSIAGTKRAIAVFLDEGEEFDTGGERFAGSSPVSHGLAVADREGLPWVVLTRGRQIRVYAARQETGVGRKGRAETFVEANLALLPDDRAGFVPLLFSADALKDEGTFDEILERSRDYAADLGARLRERVYNAAVPSLAVAMANRHAGELDEDGLRHIYEQALIVLFRLLFIAYAEDKDLLPYRSNGAYREHALKTLARDLADRRAKGPLIFDEHATDLWDDVVALWLAVDRGNVERGVPAYNGGLFSSEEEANAAGAALSLARLTNAEFGSALAAMLVDETEDGVVGPVDFRSLSVREFGTVYEGLLESSLSVAPSDLTVDSKGTYVPARAADEAVVRASEVYFHDRSGSRKATGSYFTKPFAVKHLLDYALEPALEDHVTRLHSLLDEGEEAKAAAAFFDFRCVDLAMGSGHFLVAAVDRIEARLSAFLALHPIPQVTGELDRLRKAALNALGALADGVEIERTSLLRRQVARRCIYGVDANPIAVELARLSIWIHTFVPGLPLSFLDHSLVHGDSLTGIGTLDEAIQALDPEHVPGQASLFRDQILSVLSRAEGALTRLAQISESSRAEIDESREAQDEAREAIQPARNLFDLVVAARLGEAASLHAFDEHGVAANPHLRDARTLSEELNALHFPIAFPEVFLREPAGFDCIIGNPPWEEATVEELGFWAMRYPGLKSMSQADQRREVARLRDARPDLVLEYEAALASAERQRNLLLAGPYPGMSTGDPDLYKAFAWRFLSLVRRRGYIGIVLPHSIFATKGSAPWRRDLFETSSVRIDMCRNVGEWLFTDVNPGYSIDLVVAAKDAEQKELSVGGTFHSEAALETGARERSVVSVSALSRSDDLMCVPAFQSPRESQLFAKLLELPTLGQVARPDFTVRALTELHATNDSSFFSRGTDPVFNHTNIGHLAFDPSAVFATADFDEVASALQERRMRSAGRRGSPLADLPATWFTDLGTLPCLNPRIAFRDVVHATNPRKVWAALVPARSLLTNKAPYLVFSRGDRHAQAYLLGMLGSSVSDWFGHLRVVLNLNFFIFYAIPIPHFQATPAAVRLARLAASLAVTGEKDRFGEWAELVLADDVDYDEAVAEIDAIASLLYVLDEDELEIVWTDDAPLRPNLDRVREFRDAWRERE